MSSTSQKDNNFVSEPMDDKPVTDLAGIGEVLGKKLEDKEFDTEVCNMSSTSQKHNNFVSEPMGDKPVTDLAGIGEVLGKRLEDKGFDKAYVVLGQFLVLKKQQELFIDWMKDLSGANQKQAKDCYQCLSDWCDEFL